MRFVPTLGHFRSTYTELPGPGGYSSYLLTTLRIWKSPIMLESSLHTHHTYKVLVSHVPFIRHPKVWRSLQRDRCSVGGSVEGSCSVRELPGRWQFRRVLLGWQLVAELANEKRFIPSRYTANLCISRPRISGNLVGCRWDPTPQVAQPDRESSIPLSRIAGSPLSVLRQSL
ncbi:hypothetical protein BDM02DRAFT_1705442 [Thelephora ganbajun]|uniref:Uncharacterized protein n=1 Tax=Thelephora ganbajun TaxID=370292 RepID=A0ACB6ZJW1_THEGA|nr:hypothetical protein BDM02DRAFT_1705442 [Thelephora ganbajun]